MQNHLFVKDPKYTALSITQHCFHIFHYPGVLAVTLLPSTTFLQMIRMKQHPLPYVPYVSLFV